CLPLITMIRLRWWWLGVGRWLWDDTVRWWWLGVGRWFRDDTVRWWWLGVGRWQQSQAECC
uniref:Uncharacterized protein n=1 Tax=Labrus bergylta TaxID=56723 RepID=A0A3Q3GF98_9LABR